eukprot:scaffold494206_cov43-Prasinocladus_malaysianus.AAC.1
MVVSLHLPTGRRPGGEDHDCARVGAAGPGGGRLGAPRGHWPLADGRAEPGGPLDRGGRDEAGRPAIGAA